MLKRVSRLAIALLIAFAVMGAPKTTAEADQSTNTDFWTDFSLYCESAICVAFPAQNESRIDVYYYYVGGGFRNVYSQTVGGVVRPPGNGVCGSYGWGFAPPGTYVDDYGTQTVQGWIRFGALCEVGTSVRDGFSSNEQHWLTCGSRACTGSFSTITIFTYYGDCGMIPAGVNHTLRISF